MAIRQLSTQLAKRAQEELFEKHSEIQGHIEELRQWIINQPHLKARIGLYESEVRISTLCTTIFFLDDQFLISFLRGTSYNQQLARQKIDLFFTMRTGKRPIVI